MKKLLLISFLIISNLFSGQNENDANPQFAKIIEKSHFNTAKYDSGKNWSTHVHTNEVQASLNKFSLQRQEKDLAMYLRDGLVVAFILGVLFVIYKIFNRANAAKNNKHLIDKIIYSTIIKTTPTSESFITTTIEDCEGKDEKAAMEILESQINFINKIIANRNNKAICKNIEKALECTKSEIFTSEGSSDLNAKYKTITRVTQLMFIGFNEEPALQKTKKELMQDLNNKTNGTFDAVLNTFYKNT